MGRKHIDMTGEKHGCLVVLCRVDGDAKHAKYSVRCERCGHEKTMFSENIRRAEGTKTGGCINCLTSSFKHGLHADEGYKTWEGMMRRCYNEAHDAYPDYGGRGITVCDEWHDPASFLAWLHQEGWQRGACQIDRRENDLGYSPDNCRLATVKVNQRNKRTNVHVEIRGERMTIAEAAERFQVNYTTIRYRHEAGRSGEELIMRGRK